MKRHAPMQRTGLKPYRGKQAIMVEPDIARELREESGPPLRATSAFRLGAPVAPAAPQPKGDFDKLPAYRAWVKTHACFACSAPPPSVCCHQNVGKGQSLKVSDRLTFPLCVPCHEALDNSRGLTREQRRAAERAHVARMQSLARAAGRKEIE